MRDLYVMTEGECRVALETAHVGRVSVITADGPYVVPVNHSVRDTTIYFRVTPSSVIANHAAQARTAFEVDRISLADRTGWSVLARGRARVVQAEDEIAAVESGDGPEPWVWRSDRVLFALDWDEISGRRMWAPPA